ncbi:MAG TPA: nitronate monooxygenase family protein [Thermoanaerobaculia bacterium]|nr:nitronate monooxygenase family protein [Thermoanaerobaculia bacterium]
MNAVLRPEYDTPLTRQLRIELPIIGGAMYPCSNPELVAAISAAGAIGVVQPVSLTYVHGYDFREGLRFIRSLTTKPIGMNALIEQSSKTYHERMTRWIDIALEEGVRFFVTSLGNPRWVADRVHREGGFVYHDVTERKWAMKGRDAGVDGLIAVNSEAGGHAGPRDPRALYDEIADIGLPVVCAGGVSDAASFRRALAIGYAGVQMGTRFIATTECSAHPDYKNAIVSAKADDIVLTERLTGVPVAVIRNEYVARIGTKAGPIARWMLRGRKTKHWMRTLYALTSLRKLKHSLHTGSGRDDYWQAGRSVAGIDEVLPVAEVIRRMTEPS